MTSKDKAADPFLTSTEPGKPRKENNLLHYAAYFSGVGLLTLTIQAGEPRQAENAVIAGAIAMGSVITRDWYKARLDPSMADEPTGLINLFSEMLHAGRAQVNTNAAHMKRVEFVQADLVDALREFNDTLRLNPAEIEQQLKNLQSANLTSALSAVNVPSVPPAAPGNAINNALEHPGDSPTHVPASATVRQSSNLRRPGFDA